MKRLLLATVVLLCPVAVLAQEPPPPPPPPAAESETLPPRPPLRDRFFFGGGVGLGFGDVDYVEISPLVGFRVTPRLDAGLSLMYRWRSDDRFEPSLDTSDYGGTLFGRFRIVPNVFLEADFESLNWEYLKSDLSTDRETTTSFFAGGGYYQPLGGRAGLSVSALYNFSYDEDDPFEPYGSPYVFRVGFGVGF
jgi:hypothetical protein